MKQILTNNLRRTLGLFALVFFLLSFARGVQAEKSFPDPRGYVNDFAKVIPTDISVKIEFLCKSLEDKTGVQISVATFTNMGGDDIDNFTVRLFEQWKVGQKDKDNGILIVQAVEEHKVRIEIGYGLEGMITDAETGRIRRDDMTPLLKAGKYGEAHLLAVSKLAELVIKYSDPKELAKKKNKPFNFKFVFLIALFLLFAIIFRKRRFGDSNRWGGGGPWIGGLGGGSWGGGGFGGGGGGGFGGFGGGGSGGGGSSGGY